MAVADLAPTPRVPWSKPMQAATPTSVQVVDDKALIHLLKRTTYGVTPALLQQARTLGPTAWLERQLTPALIEDTACDQVCQRFPLARATPPQVWARTKQGSWDAMGDVTKLTIARAAWSKRQLFEVMVEFWSNHLNSTCPSSEVWATKGWDDEHVIRKHALGRFSDMLVASSTSPAMMLYLDNQKSQGKAPNENYGREVLELHTVGRDAGYGQAGVVDSARAFTGLTTWTQWNGGTAGETGNYGTFRYRADWRYTGPLKVLGWTHANADKTKGVEVAQDLMRYLAAHPATAQRIARKLAIRFVQDDPPQALVDRLAQVYLDSDTAIVPVLRALFTSPEFQAARGRKYRRPYEDIIATIRALGIEPSKDTASKSIGDLGWELGELGHKPLAWGPPDGYPDVAAAWSGSGTVLGRWNLHVGLAQGWWKEGLAYPGTSLYQRMLGTQKPATRADLVTQTAARLMPGTTLPIKHRDALVTFLGGPGPTKEADTAGMFPILVALLLDSPHWSQR